MQDRARHIMWALLNLLGFAATLVLNALANILPLNGKQTGELSDSYPNLFVPAGLTFSIWGVIYLLLTAFIVYQLVCVVRGSRDRGFLDRIGPLFLISSVANSLWIVAWHWQLVPLSLLLMLVLLGSLIAMYLRLEIGRGDKERARKLLVELPFSVYLGWITVATIANTTALLVDAGWGGLGLSEVFWAVLVIIAALVITALMLYTRGDVAYALVVLWALLGIYLKRTAVALPTDDGVELAALLGVLLVGVGIVARKVGPLLRSTA